MLMNPYKIFFAKRRIINTEHNFNTSYSGNSDNDFLNELNFDTILWELYIEKIELVAGMLAASIGIILDIGSESNTQPGYKFYDYYLDSDVDVSEYRILSNIAEDDLQINSSNRLTEGQYGIWLRGSRKFHYNLYAFRTNYFFQGIISICHTFGVDFRNYIYGFPFDGYGNQYSLANYVMAPYQVGQNAPDLDDIEEEEQDDENINEPLARTEVIITSKDTDIYIEPVESNTPNF